MALQAGMGCCPVCPPAQLPLPLPLLKGQGAACAHVTGTCAVTLACAAWHMADARMRTARPSMRVLIKAGADARPYVRAYRRSWF